MNGLISIGLGILLYLVGTSYGENFHEHDHLSVMMCSAILFWIGGFILFFGIEAFRNAAFPLLFLMFMVPIPRIVLESLVPVLTRGSAEVAHWLFSISRVPMFREGFTFHLPGLSIEVAEACSGIRSTVALLITSILAGYFFLSTWWTRIPLTLAVFPITIFKNALRIVMLSLLGLYVDERILTSSLLHTEGGIPFFVVGLSLLLVVMWGLKKLERGHGA